MSSETPLTDAASGVKSFLNGRLPCSNLEDELIQYSEALERRVRELESQPTGVHSCHSECQRPVCVLTRRVAQLEVQLAEARKDGERLRAAVNASCSCGGLPEPHTGCQCPACEVWHRMNKSSAQQSTQQ
jgi:hypothetical protein